MATSKSSKTPGPDLGTIVQGFVDDLRDRARTRPGEAPAGKAPARLRKQIAQVTARLQTDQQDAATQANSQYTERSDAMQAVLDQRQQRIQAYTGRQRQAVPAAADQFVVAGRVTDQASGAGLPYVRVRVTDLDRKKDDVLGETHTDALGYYRFEYSAADFKDRDRNPETYIQVLDPDGKVLFTSTKSFVQKAGKSAFIPAAIDGARVPVSLRTAQKVGRTVTARQDDIARRLRVLRLRPEMTGFTPDIGVIARTPLVQTSPAAPSTAATPAATKTARTAKQPTSKGTAKAAAGTTTESAKATAGTAKGTAKAAAADQPLTAVKGIGATFQKRLHAQGIQKPEAVAAMKPADLAGILKVNESRARTIVDAAKKTTGATRKSG